MLSFRLKHPNIIELLGFSNETPDTLCLIYPYMAEGTLKDALVKCKTPEANFVLSSNQRISIMKGKTSLVKTSFRYLILVRNHVKLLHVYKSRRGFSKGTVLCGGY